MAPRWSQLACRGLVQESNATWQPAAVSGQVWVFTGCRFVSAYGIEIENLIIEFVASFMWGWVHERGLLLPLKIQVSRQKVPFLSAAASVQATRYARCAAFSSAGKRKLSVSHFDPNFITVQQHRSCGRNVLQLKSSLRSPANATCKKEKKKKLQWKQLRRFFSSSPHHVFQEVQSEAGSLHNMQSTHSHTQRLYRMWTGRRESPWWSEPLHVYLVQSIVRPPTHREELSCCSRFILWWIMHAHISAL